ncbi:MAG: radical SAM protein [Candidatus Aminicenantes bacterium]|nr:radical SAM protein [Candidatus Aminicenantes bacterium]
MKKNSTVQGLPGNYFEGKDGLTYRFTILKDIAVTGAGPVPYEDSLQDSIYGLYGKYKDFALYVHFPWCIEHCSFCHYYRGPILKREELEKMLAAERKHAQMFDEKIDLRSKVIRSIYFGGGTPTVIPTDLLEEALEYYVGRYGSHDECEVCVEVSPLTLKPQKIDILERYVDRLSIGVQSFDDRILKSVERKHTGARAIELLQEVVPRFPSVNVDLIYGLYDQDLETWLKSIEEAINVRAQSLTIYRLDIREMPRVMTLFREQPDKFPDEQLCWQMYREAKKMLEANGYRENLIGWFLLPSVKDTTVYRERWEKQSPCIAFGPALHNYGADHFYETLPGHEEYIQAVEAGKLPIKNIYTMTPEKQLTWYVLAQFKSNSPIYKTIIIERFGSNLLNRFMELARKYITWGVLKDSGDKLEITEEYHYLIEWMLLDFIGSLK